MQLHNSDFEQILPTIPNKSIDLILTDLPYGNKVETGWDDHLDLPPMWDELKRIIKPNHAIVLFSNQPFTTRLINSNPDWFKYHWIWAKSRRGDNLNAKNKPMTAHEEVLVFSEGTTANCSDRRMPYYAQGLEKYFKKQKQKNALAFGKCGKKRPSWQKEYLREFEGYPSTILYFDSEIGLHATQKPVPLLEFLVQSYTLENETVLDYTMGSGSTGVACAHTNRNFIGIERDKDIFEMAQKRITCEQNGYKIKKPDDVTEIKLEAPVMKLL
jgi:site-specific DNA-methyltransferase (adenine-specific)